MHQIVQLFFWHCEYFLRRLKRLYHGVDVLGVVMHIIITLLARLLSNN
jgi:hypothetical protein